MPEEQLDTLVDFLVLDYNWWSMAMKLIGLIFLGLTFGGPIGVIAVLIIYYFYNKSKL